VKKVVLTNFCNPQIPEFGCCQSRDSKLAKLASIATHRTQGWPKLSNDYFQQMSCVNFCPMVPSCTLLVYHCTVCSPISRCNFDKFLFTRESSYCFQRVIAIAILSVSPSVTRVDQSKTVQARITKSSPSAARKTLVSGTVKLFHKFKGSHPEQGH